MPQIMQEVLKECLISTLHRNISSTQSISTFISLFTSDQWKNQDFMRKLSTAVFQSKAEAIITPSELNKLLQAYTFHSTARERCKGASANTGL